MCLFFLTPGLGWRLALPREQGRSGRAAPSVGLRRACVFPVSSSSRPGGPAALRHVCVTCAAPTATQPRLVQTHRPPGGPSQPSDKCFDSKWPGQTSAQPPWSSIQYLWWLNLCVTVTGCGAQSQRDSRVCLVGCFLPRLAPESVD